MTYQDEINKAVDLYDDEKFKKAVALLCKLIKDYPNEPRGYFERGMSYLSLDSTEEAIQDFHKCLSLDPQYPGARDWLSNALSGSGKKLAAAGILFDSIRDGKTGPWDVCPQKWADCAELYLNSSDAEKAKEVLEIYFSEYEVHVQQYVTYITAPLRIYAKTLIALSFANEALAVIEKAMCSIHKVPADNFMRVECLAKSGDMVMARIEFAKIDTGYSAMQYYKDLKKVVDG